MNNEIINTELLENKEYLSVKDMEQTFHIHENTIYIWIKNNQLPKPIKFRQKNYWNSKEIKEWFDNQFQKEEV